MELFDVKEISGTLKFKRFIEKGYNLFINAGGNNFLSVLFCIIIENIEDLHVRRSCNLLISK